MTMEDIIRMAKEAGLEGPMESGILEDGERYTPPFCYSRGGDGVFMDDLERFAALVAAAERESCAKVVENYAGAWDDEGYAIAQAIRARGEK